LWSLVVLIKTTIIIKDKMPKNFMECVKKIKAKRNGNPYAICRVSTGFYGAVHHSKNPKLILTGKPAYVKHMFLHLRKEHPSTRRRMKII